ncbi:MAG: hypothetical protein ABW107_21035 [Candidatus Thiodiazotropha sp. 6PLUC5]
MRQTTKCHYFFQSLALLLCLSFFDQLNASEHEYLQAIKADYEEFSSGVFDPPSDSPWISVQGNSTDNNIPSYENLEDFSAYLKKESPGSFIFYNKLPESYKSRLHQEYLKTGNLEEIKKNIYKYSSEVKKQNQK